MADPTPDPTPAEGPDPYGNPAPEPEWLGVNWQRHLEQADVGGATVNYAAMGSGTESLLFVHGLAGCWQNWLEQLPHFARTHRVVALDLPGFGHSPMPSWDISIPAFGKLIRDLCAALGLERTTIVGNSLGGFVATEAVRANPGRFDRLALVAAAGVSTARQRPGPTMLAGRLAAGLAPLVLSVQERAMRRPGLRRAAFRTVFHDPAALRRELLHEQYVHGTGRPAFLPALSSLVSYDFLDRLETIAEPTLIVAGRNDLMVPPADAVEYGRLLRNSETVVFDRTGHCPQLERPVRFNRALEAFLAR